MRASRLIEDHPLVRRNPVCPLCGGVKDFGLVTCWSCYRSHDLRNGNVSAEAKIDKAEADLKG